MYILLFTNFSIQIHHPEIQFHFPEVQFHFPEIEL